MLCSVRLLFPWFCSPSCQSSPDTLSFQVNRERLLQLSIYLAPVILCSAVEFGVATSSVLFRHGSPEDRKDEERNWKNHQRGITTQGNHGVIRVRRGYQYENFKYFFGRSLLPLTNRVRGPYCKLRTEFLPSRFMAHGRRARTINWRGKTGIRNILCRPKRRSQSVRHLLYFYCVSDGFGDDFRSHKGFKFLTHVERKLLSRYS